MWVIERWTLNLNLDAGVHCPIRSDKYGRIPKEPQITYLLYVKWEGSHHMRSQESRVKVLTEAGAVPAVVSPGTVRDAAVPQEPHPQSFAPQTDTAGPRLQVGHATLTAWAALWKQGKHANHCKYSKLGFSGLWEESKTDKVFNTNAVQSFCQEKHF